MLKCLNSCRMWSVLVLLAGATSLPGSERITPEVAAVRRTIPSVGNIHTEKAANPANAVFAADKAKKINGMGTGIVIDERGYLVTNYHVIADVDVIRVEFEDDAHVKSSYTARKVRVDRDHDLAIIKVDSPRPFKVMPSGTSSDLMLGEKVIAIGNAYGYDGTITLGIVSALGRDVEANETVSYKNLIQTDAAINPGNSGGPLINMDGEVIGINVAIRANAQKIGFAIPIDDARKIIKQMISVENLDNNFHGLITKDVKSGMTRMLLVDGAHPESPAAAAGLRPGDIVVKAGALEIVDGVDLERALLHRNAGDRVEITVKRNDKTERMALAIGTYTGGRSQIANTEVKVVPRANNDESDRFWSQLGLRLVPLPETEKSQLSKTLFRGGMRVQAVRPGSPADTSQIAKNDILVGLEGRETLNTDNVTWILEHSNTTQNPLKFLVVRDQQKWSGTLVVSPASAPRTALNGN